MILHVESFFAKENPLDELIEVLVIVADQSLDLPSLGVSDDLILYNLSVSWIWEHQRENGER